MQMHYLPTGTLPWIVARSARKGRT